ncbi:MAG TPA: glycosyltransferase family A protein [Acidimicrobiales bacterium]|nr:glycosyltransferase family A protein [Acidimicrobiales bacterium]
MGSPLVSVLVPTYNAETFVGDCLRSIMAQTYADIELIVVDDRSTDATFEVARETLGGWPGATVLRNDVNLGNLGNARRLLTMARGPLVKFVCNDDLLAPEAISRLVAALVDHPQAVLATSHRTPIDSSGAPLSLDLIPLPPFPVDALVDGMAAGNDMLCNLRNWIGEPTTVLFRRHLLPPDGDLYKLGDRTVGPNADVAWWLKMLAQGPAVVINEHLSSFRVHPGQVTRTTGLADLVLDWYDIIVGSRAFGYLAEPELEISSWTVFADTVSRHAHSFDEEGRLRAIEVTSSVASRLGALCPV